MCLQPIHIINKTRCFNKFGTRVYQSVPCGHCKDCKSREQDDWYIRAFFEYKNCISKGGAVWFPTLTYDDAHLPHWQDENFSFPCFSYSHILAFRKALRTYLKRFFFNYYIHRYKSRHVVKRVPRDIRSFYNSVADDKVTGLRFVLCSEFGGDKGRPHYHALLFVPFYIGFNDMNDILKKCWIHGMVRWSVDKNCKNGTRYKPLVLSSRGIKYVMKYISKDDSWSFKYNLFDYKSVLQANDEKDKLLAFKRSCPRHYQSMLFGSCGLSSLEKKGLLTADKVANDKLSLVDFGATPDSKGNEYPFRIPMYYVRKLCYDYDKENELWKINNFGKEVFSLRFQRRFRFTCDYFNEWLQSRDVFISKMFGVNIWDYMSPKSPLHMFQTKGEIYDYISMLLAGRNTDLLALYSCLYQGLQPKDYHYLVSLAPNEQHDLLVYPQYVATVINETLTKDYDIMYEKYDCEFSQDKTYGWKKTTYADLVTFQYFDTILALIHEIEKCVGLSRQYGYMKDKVQKDNSKCVINKMIYGHV